MLKLSQRDSRWSFEKIGKTNITVGRMGCTITCLAMLSSYFGCYKTPGMLAKYLSYTKDALLIWSSIPSELCFSLHKRFYGYNAELIAEGLKLKNTAVILQVQGYHWVVAISKIPLTKTYIIADPWTGKLSTTLAYKNQITGGAVLIK